jgi:hypothetical protein
MDQLPAEWLKLILPTTTHKEDEKAISTPTPEDAPSAPDTKMGQILMRLINKIFRTSYIPKLWQTALVVSIGKQDPLTDMNNYRGISLMATGIKLVSAILTKRISQALEARGLLVPEQAGFRNREECMGQVLTLVEVAERRRIQSQYLQKVIHYRQSNICRLVKGARPQEWI